MTQPELATKAHVTDDTVRSWEAGDHTPTQKNLQELSRVFGLPIDQLWEAAVLLVPEFDVGIHLFPAPPVAAREELVIEPINRKLRAQNFDRHVINGFDELGTKLEGSVPGNSSEPHYKARLLEWVKQKKTALVLCGFRPPSEQAWRTYIEIIGSLKYDCCIVVIQAVDPFHIQPLLNAGSQYGAKTYPVEMAPQDYAPGLCDLRDEIPGCCMKTILALLDGRTEETRKECVAKLIDAKIMARRNDGVFLTYGSEPQWREIVEQ